MRSTGPGTRRLQTCSYSQFACASPTLGVSCHCHYAGTDRRHDRARPCRTPRHASRPDPGGRRRRQLRPGAGHRLGGDPAVLRRRCGRRWSPAISWSRMPAARCRAARCRGTSTGRKIATPLRSRSASACSARSAIYGYELWLTGVASTRRRNGHGRAMLAALLATPAGRLAWIVRVQQSSGSGPAMARLLAEHDFVPARETESTRWFLRGDAPDALAPRIGTRRSSSAPFTEPRADPDAQSRRLCRRGGRRQVDVCSNPPPSALISAIVAENRRPVRARRCCARPAAPPPER